MLLLLAGLVTHCATYHAEPLSERAVKAALAPPDAKHLRIRASELGVPLPGCAVVDWRRGLTPDAAAVIASVLNPAVRAARARHGVARAQLVAAGILPNPKLGASADFPFGPHSDGEQVAYGVDLSWEISALVSRRARKGAAQAAVAQIDLDIAWTEWQAAEAAKAAVYHLVAVREELVWERAVVERLRLDVAALARAAASSDVTLLEVSAAKAALREAELADGMTVVPGQTK